MPRTPKPDTANRDGNAPATEPAKPPCALCGGKGYIVGRYRIRDCGCTRSSKRAAVSLYSQEFSAPA